jgi:hypothetical protein
MEATELRIGNIVTIENPKSWPELTNGKNWI